MSAEERPVETYHMMIDVETLGTAPGSVILEIGAVVFDPYGPLLGDYDAENSKVLYRPIDITSCLNLDMKVSAETLMWWFMQTHANRDRIATSTKTSIISSVDALRQFHDRYHVSHIWSHGASFDIVMLEWVYRRIKKDIPWTHKVIRDTRTLFELTEFDEPTWKRLMARVHPHHPGEDAWAQARAVQYCLNGDADETSGHEDPAGARFVAG